MKVEKFNARVWKVNKVKGSNVVIANISTYDGADAQGNPIYSTWSGRFVGDAYKPATKLEDGEKIGVVSGNVSTNYDKKTKKLYANMTIFEFDEPMPYKKK